jgi:hypothetical protein
MGDYLRRMKAKLGPAAATTATAHKIAIIFYTMVNQQVEYDASLWGAARYNARETIGGKAQEASRATRLQTRTPGACRVTH